jgi:DNA-binding NarL/FixJ family response regulator
MMDLPDSRAARSWRTIFHMTDGKNSNASGKPDTGGTRIRTVIADDSAHISAVVCEHLLEHRRFDVVGFARNGIEAVESVCTLKPELVIIDISMPEMNGLDATRLIKATREPPVVVIFSLEDSSSYKAAAEKVGADGFCSKLDVLENLLPTVLELFGEGETSEK